MFSLRLIPVLAATVTAGFLMVITAMSSYSRSRLTSGDPFGAFELNPFSANAAAESARLTFTEGKFEEAQRFAKLTISNSPLDQRGIAFLGLALEQKGDPVSSRAMMMRAASLGWRTPMAQYWMVNDAFSRGDLDAASLHADALLRQRLYVAEMLSFLRGLASTKAGIEPVAKRLARNPQWRSDFLTKLQDLKLEGYTAHEAILNHLRASGAPPSQEELRAYTMLLISNERYNHAYRFWKASTGTPKGYLSDPKFANVRDLQDAAPFAWVRHGVIGASATSDAIKFGADAVGLRVSAGGTAAGLLLDQLLSLEPGSYVFTTKFGENEPGSIGSLHWELVCIGNVGGGSEHEPTRTKNGFTSVRFTVPTSDCFAQRLQLRIEHSGIRRLDAWFTDAELRRN